MSLTAASLRDLHRIHQQQADLKDRLSEGPRRVKAAEGAIQNLQQTLDEVKDSYTRARVQADDRQLQLQEGEQRINDTQGKLNTCSTNKEFQALKNQIESDKKSNDVLSDEILELLDGLDGHQEKVSLAQQNLDNANQELEKIVQAVESGRQALENDLERNQSELSSVEDLLPGDLRAEYNRISDARGEGALAPVDDNVCGSCYQTLTPQTINELVLTMAVFCKTCGCLLYLSEDHEYSKD
jgi:predicted  nucleic acid-binding Zn-ribbon protein